MGGGASRIKLVTLHGIVNPKDGRPALDVKTITSISRTLTQDYGKGFSRQNLSLMIIFNKDYKNCQPLVGGLSWSHYVALLSRGKEFG